MSGVAAGPQGWVLQVHRLILGVAKQLDGFEPGDNFFHQSMTPAT